MSCLATWQQVAVASSSRACCQLQLRLRRPACCPSHCHLLTARSLTCTPVLPLAPPPPPLSPGVPDADFVWVAFANHFACTRDGSGSVLLQSKYCDYDPATGRPTLGGLLICPSFFTIASEATRVESLVHEAFHVLVR